MVDCGVNVVVVVKKNGKFWFKYNLYMLNGCLKLYGIVIDSCGWILVLDGYSEYIYILD